MGFTVDNIIDDLKELGIKSGDSILIHSSLKSIGYVEHGAIGVIDALKFCVGENGTLIFPTLTGKRSDSRECPPVFDVMNTPCWTGIIPETGRKLNGAKRSLHPTHSAAALGFNRDFITSGHELSSSPCDKNSPYYKNSIINGYIMLLGVDQESNTSIHSCEEIAGVPYHLQRDLIDIYLTGYEGSRIKVANRLHDWNKPDTDFNHIENILLEKKVMKFGMVGNSTVRLIKASEMFETIIDILVKDSYFFLVK